MGRKKKIKVYTSEDIKKIAILFENSEEKTKVIANKIIDELVFTTDVLQELRERVQSEGSIVEMQQGDYFIDRENPALRSYNTTLKSYQNLLKQLLELSGTVSEADELELFING